MDNKKGSIYRQRTIITGNHYNKYSSKNPIEQFMVGHFIYSIKDLLTQIEYQKVIDVGCGEGFLTNYISSLRKVNITGVDIGPKEIQQAKMLYPNVKFICGSAYELPFENKSVDLVIACEVLEHLERPGLALDEFSRVTRKWLLVTVPREPLWCFLNICRAKYIRDWGNTPGHIQHWTKNDFIRFVGEKYEIIRIKSPVPWTMLLCKIKDI